MPDRWICLLGACCPPCVLLHAAGRRVNERGGFFLGRRLVMAMGLHVQEGTWSARCRCSWFLTLVAMFPNVLFLDPARQTKRRRRRRLQRTGPTRLRAAWLALQTFSRAYIGSRTVSTNASNLRERKKQRREREGRGRYFI